MFELCPNASKSWQEVLQEHAVEWSDAGLYERNTELIALLRSWREGDEDEQRETLKVLQDAGIAPMSDEKRK
jgi:hypothetical protein